MANIALVNNWSPTVYQWADGDVLDGGPDSLEVLPIKQLANNSLHQRMVNVTDWNADLAAAYGYPVGAVVRHGGVSWRAKLANNVAPGTNPTRWERWGYSESELAAALAGVSGNLTQVVNNTYIGPTPQKVRAFSPALVLSDMPSVGVGYTLQSVVVTGARRARINAHAAFYNSNPSLQVNVTLHILVNGADLFSGHFLGAILPPMTAGGQLTQIPITITDLLTDMDPAVAYTVTIVGIKQQAVGTISVQDTYIDVEYV